MRVVRAARLEPARDFLQSEPLGADKRGLAFLNEEQALPSLFQRRKRRFGRLLSPVSGSQGLWFSSSFFISISGSGEHRTCSRWGESLAIPARLAGLTELWLL